MISFPLKPHNNTIVFETFPTPIRGAARLVFVFSSIFLLLVEDQVEMVLQVAVLWWMS